MDLRDPVRAENLRGQGEPDLAERFNSAVRDLVRALRSVPRRRRSTGFGTTSPSSTPYGCGWRNALRRHGFTRVVRSLMWAKSARRDG